jgi:hypothetical protein
MTEAEFLQRIDRHIAVANEHMAHGNEHMARGNEHMARGNELIERVIDLHEDQRTFMRDLTRRNELASRELVRAIEGQRDDLLAQGNLLRDMREESQAQSDAIRALIDELRSGGLGSGR